MVGPSIASMHIYPVKGLRGLSLTQARLWPWGLEADRRWMVADLQGRFITQRTCRNMALISAVPTQEGLVLRKADASACYVHFPDTHAPVRSVTVWKDTVQARDAGEDAALWLEKALGQPCRLVWMDTPRQARLRHLDGAEVPVSFADGYPLLVANMASLADLNTRLPKGQAVPMARFRANIVVQDAPAWAEDGWMRIGVGTAILRILAPCSRCVVTTIDQTTAEIPNPKEPLATLAAFHRTPKGVMFAQNAVVEQSGLIEVGAPVRVLDTGPSNLLAEG
ncbi:MOSC domain-containing protein [Acetobacter pomorum]|uniref:MOSC domain-containing protein n=1 Tax=Acetobacter pomorum TaxID=65959 RepID=A0A2G4RCP4_9PROT|nr:MOSC N-terminal beta barrel domain-containing protein [Acetobacter pomorum]PHY94351.1 MOSC domain-containing protein [Acetobacter pomorum]